MKRGIRYKKKGVLRFISHLDTERLWRRAVRRAHIPVKVSQGFSLKERLEMGYPLPVGCESETEDLVLELVEPLSLSEVKRRLGAFLPEGLGIVSILSYDKKESLFQRTKSLSYQVNGKTFVLPVENGRSPKIWDYLSQEFKLPLERVRLFKVTRIGVQYKNE